VHLFYYPIIIPRTEASLFAMLAELTVLFAYVDINKNSPLIETIEKHRRSSNKTSPEFFQTSAEFFQTSAELFLRRKFVWHLFRV
jgi:hypothetical protein